MPESNQEQSIITSVEAQQRHRHRYNISIDGEYAFSVHEDVVVKFRLIKGAVVTERLRHEVLAEEELNAAYRYAIRYIGHAMRSAKEVRDKLKGKSYSPEIIDQVIARMSEQRFVDDEFYASALAKQRLRSNKKGSLWIRRELTQKGVDKAKVEQALMQFDKADEKEQAWELAAKRWRSTNGDTANRLRKITALLQRRGFTSDAVRSAIDRLRKSAPSEEAAEWDEEGMWYGADED